MSNRSVGSRARVTKAGIAAAIWVTFFAALAIDHAKSPADAEVAAPVSIAKDCSVDVTAPLLTWIASVPDGSTLSFPSNGCYRIEGTLAIKGRANLVFDGNGATFRAFTAAGKVRNHWWIGDGSRNITLRDMVIRGPNPHAGSNDSCFDPTHEFQHGVALSGVQGALLENLQIYDVYGDSVYLGDNWTTPNRNVTVRGGRFERNGRQGFGIVNADGITLDRNYLNGVCMSVFDLEPEPTSSLNDITITNNTVGEHRHLFLPNSGYQVLTSNVLVANNRILGEPGMKWPHGPGSSYATINVTTAGSLNWVVRNNDFARFEGTALRFVGATGVTVTCNRVRWIYQTGTGVYLTSVRTATITNNRFVGGSAVVSMTSTSGLEMSGNTLNDDPIPTSCGTVGPVAGATPPAPSPTLPSSPSPTPTASVTLPPSPVPTPTPVAGPDWAVVCTTTYGPYKNETDAQANASASPDSGNPHCEAQQLND